MSFVEARDTFLKYHGEVCRDPKYCPQNIWMCTVGMPPVGYCTSEAKLNKLIDFVLDILNDSDINTGLDTLFKDTLFRRVRLHDLTPKRKEVLLEKSKRIGLFDNLQKEARKLGSPTAIKNICYESPWDFIDGLFDNVDYKKVTLPPNVQKFYKALLTLSAGYINMILHP